MYELKIKLNGEYLTYKEAGGVNFCAKSKGRFKKALLMIVLSIFLLPHSAFAITYATWNPSDKSSNITLSNGNLSATAGATTWSNMRSTIGVSSGKWYWETTPNNTDGTGVVNEMMGVANSSATLTNYLGSDANGWAYYGNSGVSINNSNQVAYGATYNLNDVIGVALDMDAGTITFYKNCSSQGQAFSGLTGTQYAGHGMFQFDTSTTNFGASAFSCTVPSGYNAGLYSGGAVATPTPIMGLVFSNWWQ